MTTKAESLSQWYDQRSQRERIVLLICIVIVLLFLVNLFVLQPYFKQCNAARSEVTELRQSVADLQNREAVIRARKGSDPDKENRLRLEVLTQEAEKLHHQLEANIVSLVSPREMPALLKDLLTQQKKLQLLSLENLSPELLQLDKQVSEDVVLPTLYRHRLRMEFSGDYLTLLKYLRQLEQLPRAMVWEEVEVAVASAGYPKATVRLQVYTLSLTEGWIGG
ncbi:MAG: type II secretion system protein GspM [Desulfuromusa sp.]|nr:type II secretion system protein GspM [Desulfuromusa sp.]